MQRTSLDERLGATSRKAVVDMYARLPVLDFAKAYGALCVGDKKELAWFLYIRNTTHRAHMPLHPMLCDTVYAIIRSGSEKTDSLLFATLVTPIFELHLQKEAKCRDYTLRAEGDSIGPVEDDHCGRSVSSP